LGEILNIWAETFIADATNILSSQLRNQHLLCREIPNLFRASLTSRLLRNAPSLYINWAWMPGWLDGWMAGWLDGWMSCSSCHAEGHSNEQLNDNYSDGSFGSPKRVLSLLGVAETGPWAWNGSVKSLREQVDTSVQKTMQGKPISTKQADAIVEYMGTLKLPKLSGHRSIDLATDSARIEKGGQVFEALKCARCHELPLLTTPKSYTLDDSNISLNPPSLRSVKHASRFFHDSRADSLEEVFIRFRHQLNSETSVAEFLLLKSRFVESL
jgi:Di-haem oxidoreductase, putative peroxidase